MRCAQSATSQVYSILDDEGLRSSVRGGAVSVPHSATIYYHGDQDDIIPYASTKAFIMQQCIGGGSVQSATVAGTDHIGGFVGGLVGAMIFLRQSLDLQTPKTSCERIATAVAPGSSVALSEIGSNVDT